MPLMASRCGTSRSEIILVGFGSAVFRYSVACFQFE